MTKVDRSTWRRVRFGDVVTNTKETVKDPVAEGLGRVVALEHMEPGNLQLSGWQDAADGTTFTRRFRADQTLFAKRRAYQRKVAYAEFDGVCSGDILVFEAKPSTLLPELLPFIVQSDAFFERALRTSAGSLSPRTKWQDLATWEFDLPPLDEQRRIAGLLWAAHDLVRSCSQRQGAMSRAIRAGFERMLANEPVGCLGDLVTQVEAGGSPEGRPAPPSASELGVLKVSAVGDGVFRPDESKALLRSADFSQAATVRRGDLLVTRANASLEGVARVCITDGDYPNLMLSDKTWRLHLRQGPWDSEFVMCAMQAARFRRYVEQKAGGTGARNISQRRLLEGPVPVPSVEAARRVMDWQARANEAALNCRSATDAGTRMLRALSKELL